jgi:hypothetical protein
MKSLHLPTITLSLLLALTACESEVEDTDIMDTGPEDTGWPESDVEVQSMAFELTEVGIDLSFTVSGWASNTRFNAYNTDVSNPATNGWDEEHSPPSTETSTQFDPQGVTDTRGLSLEHVTSIMYWKANQTTLFNAEDQGKLTYGLRIYDGDGALAQCLVWGQSPGMLYTGAYSKVNFTSEPEEFNATNCVTWTE